MNWCAVILLVIILANFDLIPLLVFGTISVIFVKFLLAMFNIFGIEIALIAFLAGSFFISYILFRWCHLPDHHS